MNAPTLRLYNSDTGEVVDVQSGENNDLLERINELEQDKVNLQRQNVKLLRRIKALERDRDQERADAEDREWIERIFRRWQEICGHPNSKLTGDRFDAIQARIKDGYEPRHFDQAIDGAKAEPFETQSKSGRTIRHDDIELICRDGKHFESFANRAPKKDS